MKEQILQATNGGLDVILAYYPDAAECIDTPNKHFRMRAGESDASASIKKYGDEWKVTDFGADARAKNCFDIVMAEEGFNFIQAIYYIADRFNINIGYKKEVNKPNIEVSRAADNDPIGVKNWEEKENPWADAALLGNFVTEDVMRRYKITSLKSYTKVYVRKEDGKKYQITISSNEHFPIFLFDYGKFQKIQCPMAYDKKDRFFYMGEKPSNHVFFGLEQVQKMYAEKQSEEEEEKSEKKSKKSNKLDYIFICAGERDALNCIGMGYAAVWLNSETAELSEASMNVLYRYADKVINIPDLDETGIKMAKQRALDHWRMYTLMLPEWITTFKDRRGKARKDLTDFCELSNKLEFAKLIHTAVQCQFWEQRTTKDGNVKLEVNTISLLWFLHCHGFCRITSANGKEERYVRVKGYKVEEYDAKKIRAFVKAELRANNISVDVQRLYQDSKKTTAALCDDLVINNVINMKKSTHESRMLFFDNLALKVTADGIEQFKGAELGQHCWESSICPHRFKRIEPCFTLEDDGEFKVNHTNSKFFASIINASRMYWREEMENRVSEDERENELYKQQNKFSICGARLTAEEKHEQQLHLANKCYGIGYMLHQFKKESQPMAVWIMENKLTEDGESSGGSGKSFLINAIKRLNLLNVVTLAGREKGLTENKHLFDRVTSWTDLLLVDDPRQYFDFDTFYSTITGNITVNRKGLDSYEIDYRESPIPVFASNFPPIGAKQGSTERRLLYLVYSDYYHAKGTQYNEARTIADDFGKDLFGHSYTEEEYNADYNFCIDCLQFYLYCLREGVILRPPMENVYKRINIAEMGNSGFYEWAELYFSSESEYIDCLVSRAELFENFRTETGNKQWSAQKFKKALAAYCENSEHIICLDPLPLRRDGKRITRKVGGKMYEFFYIQTQETLNETIKNNVF